MNRRRGVLTGLLAATMAATVAVVSLGLGACNTPFIPIPPPGDPTFTPVTSVDASGLQTVSWQVSGQPSASMARARVFVYNGKLGVGVIARAGDDGAYVAGPLDGQAGDPIEIFYETPKPERSTTICRPLQEGTVKIPCP
jgi:hypothetical protein